MKAFEKGKIALKVVLLAAALALVAVPILSPLGFADDYTDLQNANKAYNQTQAGIAWTK